jgi:hypothetical protein
MNALHGQRTVATVRVRKRSQREVPDLIQERHLRAQRPSRWRRAPAAVIGGAPTNPQLRTTRVVPSGYGDLLKQSVKLGPRGNSSRHRQGKEVQ